MSDWIDVLNQAAAEHSPEATARTALLQQQASGAAIQNRVASMQADYMAQLPAAMQTAYQSGDNSLTGPAQSVGNGPVFDPRLAGPPASDNNSGDSDSFTVDRANAINFAQRNFTPIPANAYAPAELHALQLATMAGNQAAVQTIQQQHQLRVETRNAQMARSANQFYTDAYAVANAPDGQALTTLKLLTDPNAQQLAARYEQEGLDDDRVRSHAAELAAITYTTSKFPVDYKTDGVARDMEGRAIPGYHDHIGLSPENIKQLGEDATAQTETFRDGVQTKLPRYEVDGFKTPDAWVQAHVAVADARKNGSQTPYAAYPSAPVAAPGAASAPQSRGPLAASGAPAAPPPRGPAQPPAQPQQPLDATTRAALTDQEFKLKITNPPAGQALSPDQVDQRKATVQARTDLLKDSADATATAATALQYTQAAQAIMASKGAPITGPLGTIVAQASRVFGGIDATNYAEVAKYLGNAALQGAKQAYGSRMSTSEVQLQLNELSPSVHMTSDAINNLLAQNAKSAQYTLGSAQLTRKYLAAGGDPQQFAEWREKYWSRSQTVNQQAPANASPPGRGASSVPRVASAADYASLPKGARYQAPDGSVRVKGGQ
jgi:hypothetical protein